MALLLMLAVVAPGIGKDVVPEDITAKGVRTHVEYLASDAMAGRGNGSAELELAAGWLRDRFREYGLEPAAGDGYLAEFDLPDGGGSVANVMGMVRAGEPTDESLVLTAHYDGLGRGEPSEAGDAIYNGALDNAVGVAALLELATGQEILDDAGVVATQIAATVDASDLLDAAVAGAGGVIPRWAWATVASLVETLITRGQPVSAEDFE